MLSETFQRRVMRLKRKMRARVWRLTHSFEDYEHRYETRAAEESKAALRSVATQAEGAGWAVEDVDLKPPSVSFRHASGHIEFRLLGLKEHAFKRTHHFGVAYRTPGSLTPEMASLAERFLETVGRAERDLEWRTKLTRSQLSEVSYFPAERRIEFRPSLACNHHCEFCNSVERNATDSVGAIQEFIDQLEVWKSLPVVSAVISGGEPTLLKRLPELVAALADSGFDVEIQTNGMSFADLEYAQRIKRSGAHTLLVSLHSAKGAHSDRSITRCDGAWERTVRGVDNALACDLRVHLSHVVHRDNYTETAEFMRMVHARWGERVLVRLAYVAPTGGARTSDVMPSLPTALPYLRHGLAVARELGVRVNLVGYCGVPPCLVAPEHAVAEVTQASRAREFSEDHLKLDACAGCRYEHRCPGLWRRYYERYGDPGVSAM